MHMRRKVGLLVAMVVTALGVQRAKAQAPSVTVSGVAYLKYYYFVKDSAGKNNFDIDRAYLNVNGKFAHGITTRITSDLFRPASGTSIDNSLALRIKYAYVGWTPEKSPLTVKMGVTQTPWLDWEEALWDYRQQGTMAMERTGYLSSSDLGLSLDGNFNYDQFNFTTGVYNGENYSGFPGDQGKDFMARASFRFIKTDVPPQDVSATGGRGPTAPTPSRVGGLRLTGYAQIGRPTTGGTRQRYIGLLSYRSNLLTLAGEWAATTDSSLAGKNAYQKKGTVGSVYGVLRVPNSGFSLMARYDVIDPDTKASRDRQDRVIAGASYTVSSNLRILGDVDAVTYQDDNYPSAAAKSARTQALLQVQFSF